MAEESGNQFPLPQNTPFQPAQLTTRLFILHEDIEQPPLLRQDTASKSQDTLGDTNMIDRQAGASVSDPTRTESDAIVRISEVADDGIVSSNGAEEGDVKKGDDDDPFPTWTDEDEEDNSQGTTCVVEEDSQHTDGVDNDDLTDGAVDLRGRPKTVDLKSVQPVDEKTHTTGIASKGYGKDTGGNIGNGVDDTESLLKEVSARQKIRTPSSGIADSPLALKVQATDDRPLLSMDDVMRQLTETTASEPTSTVTRPPRKRFRKHEKSRLGETPTLPFASLPKNVRPRAREEKPLDLPDVLAEYSVRVDQKKPQQNVGGEAQRVLPTSLAESENNFGHTKKRWQQHTASPFSKRRKVNEGGVLYVRNVEETGNVLPNSYDAVGTSAINSVDPAKLAHGFEMSEAVANLEKDVHLYRASRQYGVGPRAMRTLPNIHIGQLLPSQNAAADTDASDIPVDLEVVAVANITASSGKGRDAKKLGFYLDLRRHSELHYLLKHMPQQHKTSKIKKMRLRPHNIQPSGHDELGPWVEVPFDRIRLSQTILDAAKELGEYSGEEVYTKVVLDVLENLAKQV